MQAGININKILTGLDNLWYKIKKTCQRSSALGNSLLSFSTLNLKKKTEEKVLSYSDVESPQQCCLTYPKGNTNKKQL